MASLSLSTVWVHDAVNAADFQVFPLMSALQVTPTADGEIRRMASGRRRSVVKKGRVTPMQVTLPQCSRAQTDWLADHVGRTVMVRDDRGRKVYGVYWSLPIDEHSYSMGADVTFSLEEVSVDEEQFSAGS